MPHFTPVEKKILEVLSDGDKHRNMELALAVDPECPSVKNLAAHLHHIRLKLNPVGQEIVCRRYFGKWYYQHVRLLKNPNLE